MENWEIKYEADCVKEQNRKDRMKELYQILKIKIWSLAYENNSQEAYNEVQEDLDELVKLIK